MYGIDVKEEGRIGSESLEIKGFSDLPGQTGLMLMTMTVGMMLASFIAPKMAIKTSHKYTMILGFVIAIGGCLIMRNRFTTDTGFMSLFPGLLIFGVLS